MLLKVKQNVVGNDNNDDIDDDEATAYLHICF